MLLCLSRSGGPAWTADPHASALAALSSEVQRAHADPHPVGRVAARRRAAANRRVRCPCASLDRKDDDIRISRDNKYSEVCMYVQRMQALCRCLPRGTRGKFSRLHPRVGRRAIVRAPLVARGNGVRVPVWAFLGEQLGPFLVGLGLGMRREGCMKNEQGTKRRFTC